MAVVKRIAVLVVVALFAGPAMAQDGGKAVPTLGQPVDRAGNVAVDPTRNVLDLVLAAVKRLDDIMLLNGSRQDDLRNAMVVMDELRVSHIKELLDERTKRIDNNESLRSDYEDKLRKAEANRLDAIRIVDTNNVTVANERAAATAAALQKKGDDSALVLSAQVTKSADDVRTLVKTTADEQSRNLQQTFASIQTQFTNIGTRLTTLEQAGAEGIGKQKFQDPAIAALVLEVQKVSRAQDDRTSVGSGRSDVVGWIVAGIVLLISIIGSAIAIFTAMNRTRTPVQPVLPVEPVYSSRRRR